MSLCCLARSLLCSAAILLGPLAWRLSADEEAGTDEEEEEEEEDGSEEEEEEEEYTDDEEEEEGASEEEEEHGGQLAPLQVGAARCCWGNCGCVGQCDVHAAPALPRHECCCCCCCLWWWHRAPMASCCRLGPPSLTIATTSPLQAPFPNSRLLLHAAASPLPHYCPLDLCCRCPIPTLACWLS